MNARERKTIAARVVALAAVALAVGSCGGSSPNAKTLLGDALHPGQRVRSGRLSLLFALTGSGVHGPAQPLSLSVTGPFASLGDGRLPRFALTISNSAQARTTSVEAISTGRRFVVQLSGVAFVAPPSAVAALQHSYALAAARSPGTGSTPLTSLGIDPSPWLSDPSVVGQAALDGVQTQHISAGLDVPRFLADLNRVAGAGGELALAGSSTPTPSLTPGQLAALSRSIDHASVDVYVGASDHLLRRLDLRASIDPTPADEATLGGLRHGALVFSLGFTALNLPISVRVPDHALPLSTLVAALERLGAGGGAATGTSGAQPSTTVTTSSSTSKALPPSISGAAPPAYLRCYEQAGQDLVARARCAPLLNGG